ncbi:L,D-transpeptidase [Pedobacter psychroterrae]|uniref:L,D-transpeptidase n=2 Tax=Pedobacter psychroterrae TaxID=2530453 RepID=A0A4R0NLX7_9SPHI|nr:L,D-transpeptidase [Pedobacter psychroterrae]
MLVIKYFDNGGLDTLKAYIEKAELHGFSKDNFRYEQLSKVLALLDSGKFKNIEEVYPVIADLELNTAEALVKYHNFVYYGVVNPRKILSKYNIPVKRPDSLSIIKVLATENMVQLLRDIQPASADYKMFQKELKSYLDTISRGERMKRAGIAKAQKTGTAGASNSASWLVAIEGDSTLPAGDNKLAGAGNRLKTILVSMERLRWKLPEKGAEYIQVNIPDFTLTWFDGKDTVSYMKVCVGGKREEGFEEKVKLYLQTGKLEDKPKNHQTPMLFGKLNSIQVNPIWNIPVSIARSEIYYLALKDRYYLSNNNIQVYYKDRLIRDPDTIQWRKYKREKLPFKFKQGSGSGNALGKFKFVYDASSTIYLHDTNNKTAFKLADRAISHGCVRVERPLEFAEKLVKDKYQYDQLRMEVNLPPLDTTRMEFYKRKLAKKADTVNLFKLKPSWFGVKQPVPLILNYITAWADHGKIQYRPDVYGHDEAVWAVIRKFM